MTTMVTGAAGFVAAAVVEEIARRGETVVAVDRAAFPPAVRHAWASGPGAVATAAADVRDGAALADLMRAHGVRTLIHGAAVTSGPVREATDPAGILEVNVTGVARTLEAARAAGIARVVHLSSASAYGAAAYDGAELDEEATPSRPESLYAVTKFAGERTALRLGGLWGLDVRVARLTAVYGRWERDTGVRDTLSPQHQATALALAGGEAVLAREGRRDWLYSRDAAEALLALRDAPGPVPPVVNVAPGRESTVAEWCCLLAARFAGFRWRIAAPGEAPTVELHGERDRRPLAVGRLAAIGHCSSWDTCRAFSDYAEWVATNREMVIGG